MRRQDWPLRLNAWLDNVRERVFAWGEHDCVMAAADAVQAMTGLDPAAEWRGKYDSRMGAARILAANGGLQAMATKALGYPLATPRLAQRGDLVFVETGLEGPALCVVILDMAAGPGPEGVVFAPMKDWQNAWRV